MAAQFTWLSLVVSLMASFCAVIFPLDEIWDIIESVSERFHTYSFNSSFKHAENGDFIIFLSPPFADIAFFFINRKKL